MRTPVVRPDMVHSNDPNNTLGRQQLTRNQHASNFNVIFTEGPDGLESSRIQPCDRKSLEKSKRT